MTPPLAPDVLVAGCGTAGCAAAIAAARRDHKIVWQLMAQQASVQVLFHAVAHEAEAADGAVRRVELLANARPLTVAPRFVINATGQGALAAAAGAGFVA